MTHYSVWLIPCEQDLAILQQIVDELAGEYGLAKFVPHSTLHSGGVPVDIGIEALMAKVEGLGEIELELSHVEAARDLFAQSLAAWLKPIDRLVGLERHLLGPYQDAIEQQRAPHVSLLYSIEEVPFVQRQELAKMYLERVPKTICFDRARAMLAPTEFTTQAHVKQLKMAHEVALTR